MALPPLDLHPAPPARLRSHPLRIHGVALNFDDPPVKRVLHVGAARLRPRAEHARGVGLVVGKEQLASFGQLERVRTEADVVERARSSLREYEAGILADYVPYSPRTDRAMQRLAELNPRTLAIMHGSSYVGDGERALRELNGVLREIFGEP